jgi:predicted amidohydrolase YtcJ
VFTAEPEHPYAEAVALRGDRILAVGALADVERAAAASARRIDLEGQFLMPGMLDAHAHPIAGGLALVQANFRDASASVPALTAYVAKQLQSGRSRLGDVLVINGLDLGYWGHSAEIDRALSSGAFAKEAIVLLGSDGHTAWANRVARARAGITRSYLRSLQPADRQYYGFDSDLNPNGFAVDVGQTKVRSILPAPSSQMMLEAGEAAVHYMNSMGITGWLDAAVSGVVGGTVPANASEPGFLPTYRMLAERGQLSAHVVAYPVVQPDLGDQQIDVVEALRKEFANVPNLTIAGLKVFADGVVESPSQTAALTRPYLNNGRAVVPLFTPEKMNALVIEAYRRGMTVHIHAIGDLAVKQSLNAFEAARLANPATTLPFVMTHVQFADPEDIPRFGKLHVIAAMQLLWALADPSTGAQVKPFVDPGIYRGMYPARSILDSGGTLAGASDWPVSSANPFLAIAQAETRVGPEGVLGASERVPREAMMYAYTRNSAAALGQLSEIGTIAPGKRADLVLVDRDVLTVPTGELAKASIVFTMFDGKVVYGTSP